jgi:RimJ/RimL family protein N-acetyltransferase
MTDNDDVAGEVVGLRPIRESDLEEMVRFSSDPDAMGEFEWMGYRDPHQWRRRWEEDGWIADKDTWLVITTGGDTFAGVVSWRDHSDGTNRQVCFELGVALLPGFRGRGLGTEAHRVLVDHLFATTPVHRLQARTEATNFAEQRALEKAGFRREGHMREVLFRDGAWRDGLMYGLLRSDRADQPPGE